MNKKVKVLCFILVMACLLALNAVPVFAATDLAQGFRDYEVNGEFDGEPGEFAVDGDSETKWCTGLHTVEEEYLYLTLSFKDAITFDSYYLLSGDGNDPEANTAEALHSAKIQISADGEEWLDVATISNPDGCRSISGTLETAASASYVRLYITQPEQNVSDAQHVRLYSFELYCESEPSTVVTPLPVATSEVTEAPTPTEAPATEAPATEAPATEAPATEAPATDAPQTTAPAEGAPTATTPATGDTEPGEDNTMNIIIIVVICIIVVAIVAEVIYIMLKKKKQSK